MAMSDANRADAMRKLVKRMFVEAGDVATFTTEELKTAVTDIDTALDSTISTHLGTDTIEVALNKTLTDPFKSGATAAQKGLLMAYTVMKRYGVI